MASSPGHPSERGSSHDEALASESDRVDELLGELARSTSSDTFARIEELVERVVGVYGAGLERVLAYVRQSGGWSEDLASRFEGDELVSGLLSLHHLHPVPAFEGVDRALGTLRDELGGRAELALVGLADDGVARVRLKAGEGAPPRDELEEAIRDIAMQAAPELSRVAFEDRGPSSGLVQIRLRGQAP